MNREDRFILSVDIETYSSTDLAEAGVHRYVEDPSFDILLVAYAFGDCDVHVIDLAVDDYPGKDDCDRAFWRALKDPRVEKHAFNAPFERACLAKYTGYDMPPEQWVCTRVKALTLGLPGSLEAVGEAMGLKKDELKDKQGKALIQYFCKPCKPTRTNGQRTRNLPQHDPEKWELFKEYNRQDVVAERAIAKKLDSIEKTTEKEQRLWELDQHMNDNGVRVDVDMVEKIVDYDNRRGEELMEEAKELTGLENPNSIAQLKDWLNAQGVPFTQVTKETINAALKLKYLPDNVRRVLEIRQALGKASVKKYQAMLNAVCEDGRLRGILQFYGANRSGRWAGRLVQTHNLAKNSLPDLELARSLAADGDFETMQTLFGETAFVFSELVRTAFIASEGRRFVVSDFSAIEARVVAWLADEQWVLDAFRDGKDIYCETASMMYKVPVVKHGENGHLRAKGKIACLACGYMGGIGAMRAMDRGGSIPDDELQAVVDAWRSANPRIVKLWYDYERAAKIAIRERRTVKRTHGVEFSFHDGSLFIKLPGGRKLCYWNARVKMNPENGRESIVYMGVNQETKRWGEAETYGGKLVENCIAEGALVLTRNGWTFIEDITTDDEVWDGAEWVKHEGLIDKGKQETIAVDGVRMTPDHLVKTKEGWASASQSERHHRTDVRVPDGYPVRGVGWEEEHLDDPLYMRERVPDAGSRVYEEKTEVMRLHDEAADRREEPEARSNRHAALQRVALHERTMRDADGAGVEELRGQGDQSLRGVVEELRSVPGRHGSDISEGPDTGPDRRQRELRAEELPMDHDERAVQEQKDEQIHRDTMGDDHSRGGIRKERYQADDAVIPTGPRGDRFEVVDDTRRPQQVYDIKNAGPRHQFVVLGEHGPLIVHNCTQAVARDCLAEAMMRVAAEGYDIVMHVHDEMIVDVTWLDEKASEEITRLMSMAPDWAEGLPLKGETYETEFYKKD